MLYQYLNKVQLKGVLFLNY